MNEHQQICLDNVHRKCKYGNKCKKSHVPPKLCTNYFSPKGCKYDELCPFSHRIKVTLLRPTLAYEADIDDYLKKKPYTIKFYTRDGEIWYDNAACKCGKKSQGCYTRSEMLDRYGNILCTRNYLGDWTLKGMIRATEIYKHIYTSFMTLYKSELLPELVAYIVKFMMYYYYPNKCLH